MTTFIVRYYDVHADYIDVDTAIMKDCPKQHVAFEINDSNDNIVLERDDVIRLIAQLQEFVDNTEGK
jgi:hypothetical protein